MSPPLRTPNVSDNVRAEVARAGLTHRKTATLAGIPSSTWVRRMADPSGWTIRELEAVAEVLGVSLVTLTEQRGTR